MAHKGKGSCGSKAIAKKVATKNRARLSIGRGEKRPASQGAGLTAKAELNTTVQLALI